MSTDPGAPLDTWILDYSATFPPADKVGHFVVSLGAAHNDLVLTHRFLLGGDDQVLDHERQALLRLVLAQIWETHLLVAEAAEAPEIDAFLDRVAQRFAAVDDRGADLVDALRGRAGATAPHLRNILKMARHATNHYPKPGDSDLTLVLDGLAGEQGAFVVGDQARTVRALFADEVMIRYALRGLSADTDDGVKVALTGLLLAAADSVEAVLKVAVIAIDLWLGEHGAIEGPPTPDPRTWT